MRFSLRILGAVLVVVSVAGFVVLGLSELRRTAAAAEQEKLETLEEVRDETIQERLAKEEAERKARQLATQLQESAHTLSEKMGEVTRLKAQLAKLEDDFKVAQQNLSGRAEAAQADAAREHETAEAALQLQRQQAAQLRSKLSEAVEGWAQAEQDRDLLASALDEAIAVATDQRRLEEREEEEEGPSHQEPPPPPSRRQRPPPPPPPPPPSLEDEPSGASTTTATSKATSLPAKGANHTSASIPFNSTTNRTTTTTTTTPSATRKVPLSRIGNSSEHALPAQPTSPISREELMAANYEEEKATLYNRGAKLCLAVQDSRRLSLSTCVTSSAAQQWRLFRRHIAFGQQCLAGQFGRPHVDLLRCASQVKQQFVYLRSRSVFAALELSLGCLAAVEGELRTTPCNEADPFQQWKVLSEPGDSAQL